MVGGLTVAIVAIPQIEVGDDRIGAEDARCRLNGVFEQGLILGHTQNDIGALCGMGQLKRLLQNPRPGFVCIEALNACSRTTSSSTTADTIRSDSSAPMPKGARTPSSASRGTPTRTSTASWTPAKPNGPSASGVARRCAEEPARRVPPRPPDRLRGRGHPLHHRKHTPRSKPPRGRRPVRNVQVEMVNRGTLHIFEGEAKWRPPSGSRTPRPPEWGSRSKPAGEDRVRRIRLCFSMPPGYRKSRAAFRAYLQPIGSPPRRSPPRSENPRRSPISRTALGEASSFLRLFLSAST